MKRFDVIIFDVDGTLLDFGSAFETGREAMAERMGLAVTEEFRKLDDDCGWRAWREFGLHGTDSREYHERYYGYVRRHAEYLLAETGVKGISAEEMSECYLEALAGSAVPIEPDIERTLELLAREYRLAFATNGVERVQTRRLRKLAPFAERIFVSETIGTIKPEREFFEHMLRELSCPAERCLMVGDSPLTDIEGAQTVGMTACLVDRKGEPLHHDAAKPDMRISALCGLPALLTTQNE